MRCLYELAQKEKNEELIEFTADILGISDKHGINGHIVWGKIDVEYLLNKINIERIIASNYII